MAARQQRRVPKSGRRVPKSGMPRILLIDIETFPALFYAWMIYEATALKVVEPTSVCCFSAKWLGGKQVTLALPDVAGYRAGKRDDKRLLRNMWQLLDSADWVIAHNGDRFDFKKLNYRFLVHGMKPPSPYQQIDTLKEVKKISSFDSHRLNDLCRQLEIGQKVRTGGSDLWFDCLGGDMKAWRRMKKYNARDVTLLEELYLELRPWIKHHPNAGTHTGRDGCPKCGGRLQSRGRAVRAGGSYRRFQCQGCGAWSRSTKSDYRATVVAA